MPSEMRQSVSAIAGRLRCVQPPCSSKWPTRSSGCRRCITTMIEPSDLWSSLDKRVPESHCFCDSRALSECASCGLRGSVPIQYFMPSIQTAASSFAVQVSATPVHAEDEIEGVIAAQGRDPDGGLIVMPDVSNDVNRELIIALAARYRVPTIYYNRFFSELGGLISYGDARSEPFRLAAGYIDRILKGEKPAALPVQAPTKFELIINLRTAKALGITIPKILLTRADQVIE